MKKLTIFLCSILFVLWSTGEAKASFVVEGDYIFDTIANQYWVRDMLEYKNLDWDGQVSAVAARTAGPQGVMLSPWRIANANDIINLFMITPTTILYDTFQGRFEGQPRAEDALYTVIQGRFDITDESAHKVFAAEQVDDGWAKALVFGGYYYLAYVMNDEYLWLSPLHDNTVSEYLGAWVVADVVPIPGAVWLLSSGLVGIVAIRRKLTKY